MTSSGRHVDRTGWSRGPWDDEPDRLEWRVPELLSYPCLIVRNDLGGLCGYVGVPPGHPAHGKGYDDDALRTVAVHGGLTYASECGGRVCHLPAPGEPDDVWWLGFDCGHAGDYMPGLKAQLSSLPGRDGAAPYVDPADADVWGERYRDVAYVRAEVEQLARQLAEVEP